jgi:hypothetical protein
MAIVVYASKRLWGQLKKGELAVRHRPYAGKPQRTGAIMVQFARVVVGRGHGGAPYDLKQRIRRSRPKKRVQTDKLDEAALAWARERPDLDLCRMGLFMCIKQAQYMHERRLR